MGRLANFFSRRRRYDDLAISIEEHIAERTDELVAEGLTPERAAQQARREFGNPTLLAQRSREEWQWRRIEQLWADWKLTLRRLAKAPGFTTTVLLTLAIGIGANTAVFSVINRVVLRPLPYPDADQLVALHLEAPGAQGLASFKNGLPLSASMHLTFSEHNRTLSSMGVWTPGTASVTGLAEPEEVHAVYVSDGLLETLNVPALAGRWFNMSDQDPRGAKSVMLSYGYWQRRFGGDRGVIGRTLEVDSQLRTIVGVMPQGFRVVDRPFDLLVPLAFDRTHETLAGFGFQSVARLKPGVTIAMANADVRRLIEVWMDSWTNGPGNDPHWYRNWRITPALQPEKQQVIGNVASILWVVMATIGLVLLIACTNLANLLLVRAEARQMELSIRAALGAGRLRIARELLLESVTLGLAGGALAVAVAYGGLRLLVLPGADSGPETCVGAALARRDGRTRGEREPRAAPFAQCAGGGAGGHVPGAAGDGNADDPDLHAAAYRRSWIRGCRACADDPHLHSGFADSRFETRAANRERHRGQARGSAWRERSWFCERGADAGHRAGLERRFR